jgi:hypothetical protein
MESRFDVRPLVAALAVLCVPAGAAGQTAGTRDSGATPTTVPAAAAARYAKEVAWLADDAREGRGMESEGLAAAGRWIAEQFAAIGLEPAGDDGFRDLFVAHVTQSDPDNPHADPASLPKREVHAFNVVGRLPAGAPDRLPGVVVIGAHYDHLGMGGPGSLAPGVHEIHNGADDNASGTAALLEVARELSARRSELRRDVWFVAFSLEEEGLLGSSTFVKDPTGGLRDDDIYAMLNMDMVGRLRDDRLEVLGGESATEWKGIVEPLCAARALTCAVGGDGFGSSDQSSFYAAGIPVLHFFTGVHEDYHRPSDDADAIDAGGAMRVVDLVSAVALATADRDATLTYVEAKEKPGARRMAFKVRLGTIPDYAGPTDGSQGLLLAGVRPGSAADQGGLQRGDLVVKIDDHEIRGIEDYMAVLAEGEPGQTATVTVIRDGKPVELQVTFEGRD